MKNLKVITMAMFALVIFASVSFAAPVKVILGTTNQLAIPFTGKLNPNGKVVLGGIQLTWTQAAKNADVFANLPAGIAEGNYMLEINGKKRMVCVGPFSAEVGLTNLIDDEVLRANTAEAGLTNSINEVSNRTFVADTYFTNNINSTSNSLANLSSNLNFKAFMSYKTTVGDTSTVAFASSLVFSNLATADAYSTWTTNNGASFQAPVTGTYQINFVTDIYESYSWGADYYQFSIYNTPVSGSPFSISDNYWRTSGQHASYVLVQLNQGDSISVANTSPYSDAVTLYSASLSIVQVQ